jgi:hypothetical protein
MYRTVRSGQLSCHYKNETPHLFLGRFIFIAGVGLEPTTCGSVLLGGNFDL